MAERAPLGLFRGLAFLAGLLSLNLLPQLIRDDAEIRIKNTHPIVLATQPHDSPAGVRVSYLLAAIPDHLADVDGVVENPEGPSWGPCDRGPRPPSSCGRVLLPPRGWDFLFIESAG